MSQATTTTVYPARKIITMNPMQPHATHVAVRDGRVLAVGSLADMQAWGTFTLDERFAAKVLMPGLVEGHCHLKEGSMWDWTYLGWFDRRDPEGKVWSGLRSMDEVVSRLAEVAAKMTADGVPDTEPLVAWGFDPIYFGGERMTVHHVDRASATRPIVIGHANGHLMNVNSAMLRIAEITRDNEVEGVVKFAEGADEGEPTGELQEPAAMFQVLRKIGNAGLLAPMTEAGVRSFARLACLQGVTTATDLVNKLAADDCGVLEKVTRDEDFAVRILPAFQAFHGTHGAAQGAEHVKSLVPRNTDRLRYGLVKMMLDGSIQGFSARLRWPGHFNGAPNGIWVTAPAQYEADFETYHRAGLTIHTHTNGDEASEVAIDAIGRVLTRAPRPDHRHTLQHGQMIDAPLFRRMASLGLCANLFANHIWYWGDQHYEMTMGPDRANRLDACGSALAAGVPLAIHSDAPVTPLGPLFTAWCAVNRITPKGRLLGEAERITVPQALRAITLGAAWTLKLDGEIGSIECGKRADFCVLEDDPLEMDPMALKDARVWGTVLSGRVFQAQRG
ncbi:MULTISPECIES: amidohydrolase [unclassified Variovorax]|uniref:amidohydrolase n=1 Tax=unclassified Variovorax TaxID=663243 RepID=UPI000D118502|nr:MULTISPECIES: amidohydrolase [unclassified Variovorax]AVQ85462.1 amidohydrolase [Variovorax sp. PMC12]QRY35080.1 amidohydrolase [Variovorax sp. PDNC026]